MDIGGFDRPTKTDAERARERAHQKRRRKRRAAEKAAKSETGEEGEK